MPNGPSQKQVRIFILLCLVAFCLGCNIQAKKCFDRSNVIPFDSIKSKLTIVDIQNFRGWHILERQINAFGVYHLDTLSKDADLGIIYPIGSCEFFKNIKTDNVYPIIDSLKYKNEVSVRLLNESFNRLKIFCSMDMSEISWQKDDRLFFIKNEKDEKRTLIFSFSTNSWEQ